jgi:hypothetical protein
VVVTGNTVIDALHRSPPCPHSGCARPARPASACSRARLDPPRLVLITASPPRKLRVSFESICKALRAPGGDLSGRVLCIRHLNPNVQDPVHRWLDGLPNFTSAPAAGLPAPGAPDQARAGSDRFRRPAGWKRPVWGCLSWCYGSHRAAGRRSGWHRSPGGDRRRRIIAETRRLLDDPRRMPAWPAPPTPMETVTLRKGSWIR